MTGLRTEMKRRAIRRAAEQLGKLRVFKNMNAKVSWCGQPFANIFICLCADQEMVEAGVEWMRLLAAHAGRVYLPAICCAMSTLKLIGSESEGNSET